MSQGGSKSKEVACQTSTESFIYSCIIVSMSSIGYFAENTKFSVIKKCDYRPTINCFICAILILHTILFHYYNSQILFNLKSNINKTVIT